MSQPVSKIGLVLVSCVALQPFARSTGFSDEAKAVKDAACDVQSWTEQSISLFGEKKAAISEIHMLAEECRLADWDGNNAFPLDSKAVTGAISFIRALPDGVPLPEYAAEPDGSLSLDWIQSRTRVFSLSIGASDRIAYAWVDGFDKGHAVSQFDGAKVPERILSGILSMAG